MNLSAGCSITRKARSQQCLRFSNPGPERHRQGSPDISHLHDPSPPNSPERMGPAGPGVPSPSLHLLGRARPRSPSRSRAAFRLRQSVNAKFRMVFRVALQSVVRACPGTLPQRRSRRGPGGRRAGPSAQRQAAPGPPHGDVGAPQGSGAGPG